MSPLQARSWPRHPGWHRAVGRESASHISSLATRDAHTAIHPLSSPERLVLCRWVQRLGFRPAGRLRSRNASSPHSWRACLWTRTKEWVSPGPPNRDPGDFFCQGLLADSDLGVVSAGSHRAQRERAPSFRARRKSNYRSNLASSFAAQPATASSSFVSASSEKAFHAAMAQHASRMARPAH